MVLSALYCVPLFDRLTHGRRWWLWTASFFWFFSLPALNPFWRTDVLVGDVLLIPGLLAVVWILTRVCGVTAGDVASVSDAAIAAP
ncbi:MAG: hypothetical protein PVSMB1_08450 [Gemmatimonadaceae bacterium]